MHSRIVSRSTNNLALMGVPCRSFRKSYNASYYNQRFQPSQGKDNMYFYTAQHVHGANGAPGVSICSMLIVKRIRPKPRETLPSLSSPTTSSRTTTGNGDREPVTTFTRSASAFTEATMAGPVPSLATPDSAST